MDELIKEVETLINNGGSWEQWRQMYKKIYGSDYSGCKCKANKLQDLVKNWYIKNK